MYAGVCEPPVSVSPTVRPPAPCTGYVRGYGGHYYLYVARVMSWQAARDHCATSTPGAYLVEITSQAENNFVKGLLGGNMANISLFGLYIFMYTNYFNSLNRPKYIRGLDLSTIIKNK